MLLGFCKTYFYSKQQAFSPAVIEICDATRLHSQSLVKPASAPAISVEAYDFRGTNLSSVGIENDGVTECSGGWVPFFIAATRISIAIPVRGGM
jgi:hypothetical protein